MNFFSLVPKRIEGNELLDSNSEPMDEIMRSFDDLSRINKFLGGIGVYKKTLFKLIKQFPLDSRLKILDVGTGSADMAVTVLEEALRRQLNATIIGVDSNPTHISIASKRHDLINQLYLITANAFRLPFKDNSFDIVTSNLFIHHYYSRSENLLKEMCRVSRHAVVVNDLLRHAIPLVFF